MSEGRRVERIRYPSPFRCVQWGCLEAITWRGIGGVAGWCDAHGGGNVGTPIAVYAERCEYPPGFRVVAELAARGDWPAAGARGVPGADGARSE